MKDEDKTKEQLITELLELRQRVAEMEASGTERKQAEEALRESEERYRFLLESISDGVSVLDHEWRHVLVNDAVSRFVQMPKEKLLGSRPMDLFPGSEETEIFKTFQRVMETRESETVVSEYTFEDGRSRWYELRVYPVPEGILTISTDVTERKRAEEERERRSQELVMLNEIGRAVTSSLDLKAVLALLLDRARQGLDAGACSVALLDDNGDLVFHHAEGEAAEAVIGLRLKPGQGIAGHVAQSGQSALVPDAHADPHFYGEVAPDFITRDMVCVPLIVHDEVIGVIELLNKRQGTFVEDDVRMLESVATQAATAIENARLFELTQRQSERLAQTLAVSESLHRGLELEQVLEQIAQGAVKLGFCRAAINVCQPEEELVRIQAVAGLEGPEREMLMGATYRWSEFQSLMQERFRVSRSYLIRQGELDWERDYQGVVVSSDMEDRGPGYWRPEDALLVPLWGTGGRPVGVLWMDEPVNGLLPDLNTIQTLEAFANQAAIAIENARLYQVIQRELAERKRAEEEIRKLSQFQERIIDTAGVWLDVLDAEANVVIWNKAAEEISGYSGEEVVGHGKIWEWLYPDEEYRNRIVAGALAIIEKGGEEHDAETTIQGKDGQTRIISWHSRNLVDEKGTPIGSIALGHDVTERKRAEEALQESEEKYRNLVERANDGIIIVQEGLLQYANPRLAEIWGGPVEEMLGTPFTDYVHLDELPKVIDRYKRRMAGEDVPRIYETVLRRRDGSEVYAELNAGLINYQGKPADLVFIRDITERKRAERLLQTLNEASLAMQRALTPEEIFTAVAEELKMLGFLCAVFLTDESLSRLSPTHLSYEAAALKVAEKLTGLKHKDFSIPVETIDIYQEIVWGKKTVLIEDLEEVTRQWLPGPFKRFAGKIMRMLKILKSIVAPLIVEDRVIGLLSVQSADLTEDDIPAITAFAHQMAAAWRKAQLMQDLQNSLEELKRTQAQLLQAQKMEAIGQLAGGICHDFNNLLTPISGFAELLLWKAPEGSQQQEYLHQIKVAAERAAALTRQLRLFTRQAAGERHPIQLNSVVEETHDLLKRSISKEITVELSLASDLRTVEADPSQIGQVLMNLCLNACDAMPDGGTLTLETRNVTLDEEYARQVLAAQPGHYVRLSVYDTGIGMSPQVQARLFEPFFTTKEPGKGTGLGLAVAYGIVKGHSGFIQVYSEEGRGSTFQVYLPAIELVVEERKAEGLELPTGTETILVVDDEETVRTLGQRVLERCGYTVLLAENGVQALEVYGAHQGEIALVVLDVVMPEMGGLECLRRLREMDPQAKVLVSTGYTARSLARELMAEGALGVVEKPFQIQGFATAVRTTIDR